MLLWNRRDYSTRYENKYQLIINFKTSIPLHFVYYGGQFNIVSKLLRILQKSDKLQK